MPDLKGAAERLRGCDWTTPSQDKSDRLLAAQALEALAWQEEHKALVGPVVGGWMCHKFSDRIESNAYVADTPLGALLAAMEGEGK
jgi:hypothetical protein